VQGLDQVPEHLRGALLQQVEMMQVQDSVRLYNELVETCFGKCVTTFHSKNLEENELKCVETCAQKFMNMSKRVGARWQEAQAEQNDAMVQQVQQMAQQKKN
jgi:import inner membrane translocase subunit TIM9